MQSSNFKKVLPPQLKKMLKKPLLLIFCLLVIVMVATQIERLITAGTFLGYPIIEKNLARPATETDKRKIPKSRMCKDLPANTIGKILKRDVTSTSYFPDRDGKTKFTSCTFLDSKQGPNDSNPVLVTVSSQQYETQDDAKTFLSKLNEDSFKSVDIKGADKSLYSQDSNQLHILKGSTLKMIWLNNKKLKLNDPLKIQQQIASTLD